MGIFSNVQFYFSDIVSRIIIFLSENVPSALALGHQ